MDSAWKKVGIGTHFDPMLSKVISWAPNRIDAANNWHATLKKLTWRW